MKRLFLILSLLTLMPSNSYAEQPLSMMTEDGKPMPPGFDRLFLYGAAMGISHMNTYEFMEGKPSYCAPMDYVLSPEELFKLAETKLDGPHKPEFIIIAAIDVLKQKFPCKQAQQ